jgi:CubicO group peptidase (beta-lactamase class C family)
MHLQTLISKILPFLAFPAPNEPPGAPGTRPILHDGIEDFVTQLLHEYKSPAGVGIAVVRMGDQGTWDVETRGYGNAKLDGTKVTEDTIFAVGSNSKVRNF